MTMCFILATECLHVIILEHITVMSDGTVIHT